MIFLLPTRSTRRYTGKYPERVNSWSYSRSPSQQAIADFLGISRPVHIELNDGRRYIIDMKALRPDGVKLGASFSEITRCRELFSETLSQDRYDAMLAFVREARA